MRRSPAVSSAAAVEAKVLDMYDQIYKRIDDNLWKDSGCGSELDYVEQSSWILFLK